MKKHLILLLHSFISLYCIAQETKPKNCLNPLNKNTVTTLMDSSGKIVIARISKNAKGEKNVVFDDKNLREVLQHYKKEKLNNKDFIVLKNKLIKLKDNEAPGTELRWPWKCDVYCRIHQDCEHSKWIGFW